MIRVGVDVIDIKNLDMGYFSFCDPRVTWRSASSIVKENVSITSRQNHANF